MLFPNQNSTNFPLSLKQNLLALKYNPKEEYLRYHQFIVYNYLINNNNANQRGLLIFHEMGMGKSVLAASMSEYYRSHDQSRKIIILAAKSLQKNFRKGIKEFITGMNNKKDISKPVDDIIDDTYKFISLNASNMYTQMTRVDKTLDEIEFEKKIKMFNEEIEKDNFLENSLLIIDEYHNLSNSIVNGSKNAIKLYDTIMNTKNIKLIFLSGTPIINKPAELVPTFNMLKGFIDVESSISNYYNSMSGKDLDLNKITDSPDITSKNQIGGNTKQMVTLFPETLPEFNNYFVDYENKEVKNKERFKNRILGLVSYYGSIYFGDEKKTGFPKELPLIVEKVQMSSEQYSKYNMARDYEIEEASYAKNTKASERFSTKGDTSSSYRIKSRQFSNFLIPDYALGVAIGNKTRKKYIDKIKDVDLLHLDINSPKIKKLLENIKKHGKQPGLVYSEFVSGEGIAVLARILEVNGYKSWNDKDSQVAKLSVYSIYNDDNSKKAEKTSVIGGDDNFCDYEYKDIDCLTDFCLGGAGKTAGLKKKKKIQPNINKDHLDNKPGTFAIITGDISIEKREQIVNEFNKIENINGGIIRVLLISKTGAEGLDLKYIRHVHLLEPFWNYARVLQVIARAIRYLSHESLPKIDQTVQPYIYISTYPKDYIRKNKTQTTDEELFSLSINNKKIIDKFYLAMAESSLDCSVHYKNLSSDMQNKIKCKMCSPNNKLLYHPMIIKDLGLPNPCMPMTEKKIKANEIGIVGVNKKFYYTKDNTDNKIVIYQFNNKINGYTIMNSNDMYYSDLIRKILKL
jgi:superfamily II DNA or RNA helicase